MYYLHECNKCNSEIASLKQFIKQNTLLKVTTCIQLLQLLVVMFIIVHHGALLMFNQLSYNNNNYDRVPAKYTNVVLLQ